MNELKELLEELQKNTLPTNKMQLKWLCFKLISTRYNERFEELMKCAQELYDWCNK